MSTCLLFLDGGGHWSHLTLLWTRTQVPPQWPTQTCDTVTQHHYLLDTVTLSTVIPLVNWVNYMCHKYISPDVIYPSIDTTDQSCLTYHLVNVSNASIIISWSYSIYRNFDLSTYWLLIMDHVQNSLFIKHNLILYSW